MKIPILKLSVVVDSFLSREDAEKIRGYLGNLFWDNPYAHQHRPNGGFVYQYPCVQYKVIDGNCLLIGFGEGLEIVEKTFRDLKLLDLGGERKEIVSKELESYTAPFHISDNQIHYSFLTPWLALNEANYAHYRRLDTPDKQKGLLEKILIGNILSLSKSLGYTVPQPIRVSIGEMKDVHTRLKGMPMLGFIGAFSVNFEIPDYWGVGKSVSRGFGTVKNIDSE